MILLASCSSPSLPGTNSCPELDWHEDLDGDGFGGETVVHIACEDHRAAGEVTDGSDCDDDDPAVFPGADEFCNDVDDDCDGYRDEEAVDAQIGCADADHDNHGSTTTTLTCEAVDPALPCDDCDDTDSYVSPARWEECDDEDVDENCDGVADGEDASGKSYWYADADGDGFGNPDDYLVSCEAIEGRTDDRSDCDDSDALSFPDAPETCGDGIDSDCDGSYWDLCADTVRDVGDAEARFGYTGDPYGYLFADVAAAPGDLTGDGVPDLLLTAPERTRGAPIFDGTTTGDVDESSAIAWFSGAAVVAAAGAGDVDGDGIADLALASNVSSGAGGGDAWIATGPLAGEHSLGGAWATVTGLPCCARVAAGGDVDGDGALDIVLGDALEADVSLYIVPNLTAGTNDLADAWTLDGAWAPRVALIDDDGDGLSSLIAGDTTLYRFEPPISGDLTPADASGSLGTRGSADPGGGLSDAGDLDGDGDRDLLVGSVSTALGATDPGAVYILAAADEPSAGTMAGMISATLVGIESTAGPAVGTWATAGDFDGDGTLDIAASLHRPGAEGAATCLFLGPLSGTIALDGATAALTGVDHWPEVAGVTALSDVDGDGADELILNSPAETGWTGTEGAAWLLRGGDWVRP